MSTNKKPVAPKQDDEDKKKKRRFFLLFWLFIREKKNLPLILSMLGGGATVVTTAALVGGAMRVRPEPSSQVSSSSTSSNSSSETTYTVIFDAMGGEEVPSQTVPEGGYLTYVTTSLTGHAFNGWYVSNDEGITLSDPWDFEQNQVTEDFTLYASLSINTYSLSFETNGGSTLAGQTIVFGTILNESPTPTKQGYAFAGWYSDELLTIPFVFSSSTSMPALNVTLYAKWVVAQFTITFNTNGGSSVQSLTADYLSSISAPTDPVKDGFTFGGWFTDEAFTNPFVFTTMPSDNLTIYANWIASQRALLASGRDHVIYLTSTGRLFSVGSGYGSTPVEQSLPTFLEGEIITKLYANMNDNYLLTSLGRLFKWASSSVATVSEVAFNMDALQAGEKVVQFSTDNSSMYALTSFYRVFAWGTNTNGVFNLGYVGGIRNAPQLLTTPTLNENEHFIHVSNQGYMGYLVTNVGRVFSIGMNSSGQLGIGHTNNNQELTFRDVVLTNLNANEKVIDVHGSDSYTLFLTNENRLFGVGSNSFGNLGLGNTVNGVSTPTLLSVGGLSNGETLVSLQRPGTFTIVLTSLGRVLLGGFLLSGPYFTFTEITFSNLLNEGEYTVAAQSGNGHLVMLTNQKRVFGYADNRSGQLGTGDYVSTTSVILTQFIPA